ncbi:hypothetical protein [Jeotgalibaca porci]|uniref:hypothetical protein n=1 Tax=Jeotgalibaca porci TaxID=1868793 RepID=UPI0035A0F45C
MVKLLQEYWFLITFIFGIFGGAWKGITTLNETLLSIKHQLEVSNKQHQMDVNMSIEDRRKLWIEVHKLEDEIGAIDRDVTRHDEQLKTLFKER